MSPNIRCQDIVEVRLREPGALTRGPILVGCPGTLKLSKGRRTPGISWGYVAIQASHEDWHDVDWGRRVQRAVTVAVPIYLEIWGAGADEC